MASNWSDLSCCLSRFVAAITTLCFGKSCPLSVIELSIKENICVVETGKHILEAVGLVFLLVQLKSRMREKPKMRRAEGSGQNEYASEGAPTILISKLEEICFLGQGIPEMEDCWQSRYNSRVPSRRTNISQVAYVSGMRGIEAVREMDVGSSWERGHPTVKFDEGFGQAGFTAGFSLSALSRPLPVSKFRSPTVVQFALFLLVAAGCAGATWEDFANNLGSDLAPLLALFGEQVTRQYLSESYSLLDSFVFAIAPLGIIMAMVAAIRVGGNTNFRSLIGRATESRGAVEADLMSSTSPDVCELWNGEGVVRVLGSPVLLQLIYVESQKSEDNAGIYSLPEAISDGYYKELSSSNSDTEALLARQNPPSLSLNASINIGRRRSIAKVIAPFGVLLQGGVLVFAGLIQYKPEILRGNKPISYGFPMFLAGTLSLAVGMLMCAQVVELSTKETIYEPTKTLITGTGAVVWLQQGGQTVGDQLFESFARLCHMTTTMPSIMTSRKSKNSKRNSFVVIAVSAALFGFIAQFVGLRAMHATVTVIQLGAILIMTALRSFAHMQRENINDIKNPKQVEGHELDWLAKELNECKSWEVMTRFDSPLPAEESPNLGMSVVKSRARLAALSEDWSLENREKIQALQSAIEGAINHVFTKMVIRDDWKEKEEFPWHFPVKVRLLESESESTITLNLRRKKDDSGVWKVWNADVGELEAVLCLWISSLTEAERRHVQDGMPAYRLLGPATDESKIDYRLWIYRETTYDETAGPTSAAFHAAQYFGWTGDSENTNGQESSTAAKSICVGYKGDLESLCAQDLYGWFIFDLVKIIEKVDGNTTRRLNGPASEPVAAVLDIQRNGWDNFRLINSNLDILATFFSESGLGTIEEAYFYLIPAFRLARNLPFPHEAYNGARVEAERLEDSGLWEQALEIDWWLYHSSRKTEASPLDILLSAIEIRGRLRRLAERLSAKNGEEDLDDTHVRIWDTVYSGWEKLLEASEDRVSSLLRLSITCSKAGPGKDKRSVFLLALDAAENIDARILRAADVILDLARFGLENGFLDDAEALAKRVWIETIEPWNGREKTRNKEAGKLLLDTCQRKGTSSLRDENTFSLFLSDLDSMQLATRTSIYTTASTSDIAGGQIPIELLVIRGSKTPLQWAAENGQENVVRQLLKSGAVSNEAPANDNGRTALQAAAGGGHESIVKLLLGENAEVNAAPAKYHGRTALQAAAEGGHEGIVKVLLEAKAKVNAAPAKKYGRTALQAAAGGGHENIVKLFIAVNAEVNAQPAESGRTALQAAAGGGHESIMKLLIEAKAKTGAAPAKNDGRTALQAAAEGGHEGIVNMLLKETSDVNAVPGKRNGRTALQAAAGGGHESIVKTLLKAKARINAAPTEDGGRTALQAAAGGGHESIVKLLLRAKAEVNAQPATFAGLTALQAAAYGGHERIVKMLLEAKAEVNAAPAKSDGRTALQTAAEEGHEGIVKLLLEAKAEVNAAPAKSNGRTALQAAAERRHVNIVELLLEAKANVNAAPAKSCGRTALQAAVEGGHEGILKLLLEASAGVNIAPAKSDGRTALQAAAERGNERIMKLLLGANAGVNTAPAKSNGRTALQAAAGGGHEDIVCLLLETRAEVNARPAEDGGRTALQAAAEGGHERIVKLLLRANAAVNAAPAKNNGRTALQTAAGGGHEGIVTLLLEARAEVNATPAEDGGRTALQAAAEGGHERIVKQLLEKNAAVNAAPAKINGRTALQAAAGGGHESIVKTFLKAKAEINAPPAESGRTALQAATEGGHEGIVRLLIEAKAKVNAAPAEKYGRTALQAAAGEGHENIVKLFIAQKAEINAKPAESGRTALQTAAEGGHENIVKLLLEAKADINAAPAEKYGRTALQAAAGGGHENIVKLFIAQKAEINAQPAKSGQTALQAAAEGGHENIVKLLLQAGAKINAAPAEDGGRTTLQAAAEGGHANIVKLLLESKAEVNAAPTEHGRTALQAAAEGGHMSIVKLLLKARANVNATPTKHGPTALQAAAEEGHEGIVKLLLQANAEVNAVRAGQHGRTALQAAAEEGHEGVVKVLLEAKAEVNAGLAGYGRTALQVAAREGYENIVKLLLEAKADVNAAPMEHDRTALQAAAGRGHESIVKLLLEAKADVWSNGRSALTLAVRRDHESIVKLLLEANAQVTSTELRGAQSRGQDKILLLLEEFSNTNIRQTYVDWDDDDDDINPTIDSKVEDVVDTEDEDAGSDDSDA